jgi:polysaccharide export outer membrane protein
MKRIVFLLFLINTFLCVALSHAKEEEVFHNVIKPGDIVEIAVYGETDFAELSGQKPILLRVSGKGTIKYPFLGEVDLKSLSEEDAARRLERLFKEGKFIINPQVTLFISEEGRAAKITVLGAVNHPGNFPITRSITVAESIAEAGGTVKWPPYIKPNIQHIRVLRRVNGEDREYVLDLEIHGNTFYLKPDDIVILDEYKPVVVRGDVEQPGTYRMRRGYTLADAIAEAGGVTQNANVSTVKIIRREEGEEREYILDLDEQGVDFLLEERDRIIVEALGTVDVYGQVVDPGKYYIQEEMTVVDAIFMAGGLTDFADTNATKLVRTEIVGGKPKRKIKRIPVGYIMKTGNKKKNIELKDGDVIIVPEVWF